MPSAILPSNQNRLNTAATTDNKISSPNSWGVFGSIHAASSNTSAASMMRETFLPLAASKYGDGQANHNASVPASSSRVRRCSIWRLLSVRTSGGRGDGCFGTGLPCFVGRLFSDGLLNVRPSEKRILAVLNRWRAVGKRAAFMLLFLMRRSDGEGQPCLRIAVCLL